MFKNNDKKRDIIEYYCEKKSSRRISTVPYLQFNSGSKFKACKIINIPQLNIATIIKGIKDKKLYSSFIIEEESDSEIE